MAGLFVIVAGVFSLCGAILNWDWYMNHRKARFLLRMLGRGGARVFYGVLGLGLIILGGLLLFGFIE
ncbi:immunity 17 family protein [Crocosphaera sp.]|uniref:immunity 17 family protein n=1 Tax=Crocosphaera sp. TaxID=2729996 RepID=UPI0026253FF7|nr:immunity 17 family protein [Crocosphaera sp.]MDJ0581218.1 immunity 17 family protein [Crocosphaera sp.]